MKKLLSLTLLVTAPFCAQAMNHNNNNEAEALACMAAAQPASHTVGIHHPDDKFVQWLPKDEAAASVAQLQELRAQKRRVARAIKLPEFQEQEKEEYFDGDSDTLAAQAKEARKLTEALKVQGAVKNPLSPRTSCLKEMTLVLDYTLAEMIAEEISKMEIADAAPADITMKALVLKKFFDDSNKMGGVIDLRWNKAQTLLSDETKVHFMLKAVKKIKASVASKSTNPNDARATDESLVMAMINDEL
jgi:hypothetical protein